MNLVIWIHGIEGENFTDLEIQACKDSVSKTIGDFSNWNHRLFNWNQEVHDREVQLWDRVQNRGNFLTKQIRKGICFQGCDLWWTLQTLKDGQPGFINYDVQKNLDLIVKSNPFETLHFVCHSWGNWIGLRYIISHPEIKFNLISLGNPLFYGSGAFADWGDPGLLSNIKQWVNVAIENDPIATLSSDNPNPKWKGFVKDHDLSFFNPLPIKSHCAYWSKDEVQKIITDGLKNFRVG